MYTYAKHPPKKVTSAHKKLKSCANRGPAKDLDCKPSLLYVLKLMGNGTIMDNQWFPLQLLSSPLEPAIRIATAQSQRSLAPSPAAVCHVALKEDCQAQPPTQVTLPSWATGKFPQISTLTSNRSSKEPTKPGRNKPRQRTTLPRQCKGLCADTVVVYIGLWCRTPPCWRARRWSSRPHHRRWGPSSLALADPQLSRRKDQRLDEDFGIRDLFCL